MLKRESIAQSLPFYFTHLFFVSGVSDKNSNLSFKGDRLMTAASFYSAFPKLVNTVREIYSTEMGKCRVIPVQPAIYFNPAKLKVSLDVLES